MDKENEGLRGKVDMKENEEVFKFMSKEEQRKAYEVAIKSGDFVGSKEDFASGFREAIFNPQTGEIVESGGNVMRETPIRETPAITLQSNYKIKETNALFEKRR